MQQVAAIAREGSFAKAAKALRISQPALSRSIRAVEESIGVRLFERGREGTFPTDAGLAFLQQAADILALADNMGRELTRIKGDNTGQVHVGGKTLAAIPVGQWIRFEISASLGEQSTGTWHMTVTVPGQEPQRFAGLANHSPEWKTLNWLGFSSMNTGQAVWCLDNLRLTNGSPAN